MKKARLIVALVALLQSHPGLAGAEAPQGESSGLAQQIQKSSYIFVGTVQKINASTMLMVPASDRTVVVRVEDVIYTPKTFTNLAGKDVTVQLSEPNSVAAGQRLAFFTNGGLFGDSVALVEVGHRDAAKDSQELRRQIAQAQQDKDDNALQRRIASAALVVSGRVLKTGTPKFSERQPLTEHDPQFLEAEIGVDAIEKGQLSARTVSVLFASSLDVMWFSSPKLKEGQEGIFLLHKDTVKWPGIKDRYLAVDPLDFQPKDQLERIRRLAKVAR
jgi:hypothetical protein